MVTGFAGLLCLALSSQTALARVRVVKPKPKIEYRTFDPQNKPKDMPSLGKNEAALCASDFAVAGQVTYAPPTRSRVGVGKYSATIRVADVTMELSLAITVWMPEGEHPKLKAHEDGHRIIAERVYAEVADRAAREAGEMLSGKSFTGEGISAREAEKAATEAMTAAHNAMVRAYLVETSQAAQKIQVEYDRITAHGTNALEEQEAIQKSWAAFPPRLWTPPATQPATRPAAPPARPRPR
jgi:hypothetical protein